MLDNLSSEWDRSREGLQRGSIQTSWNLWRHGKYVGKDHGTADVVSLNFHQAFDKAPLQKGHIGITWKIKPQNR